MFRIRRIYDDLLPKNKIEIAQIQEILRKQFPGLNEEDITKIPELLKNPIKYKFKSFLFVADNGKGKVLGFSLVYYFTDLNFFYLDFISTAPNISGGGIGGALYERVRTSANHFNSAGIFFECLPDDPALCKDQTCIKQNIARLKFYEKYNARPIINSAYETPVSPDSDCPPYLVFDGLDKNELPDNSKMQKIVKAILERKYAYLCPPEYTEKVVKSFANKEIRLRDLKYIKPKSKIEQQFKIAEDLMIPLVVNDKHDIHHVHERGYVEAPVRIKSILKEIENLELFRTVQPKKYPLKHILAVHDKDYVEYLEKVCENVPENKSIYPYVFPIRNNAKRPIDLPVRAGYYCIDTFTPLNHNAFLAAKRAVDCTLTAADEILDGYEIAYALIRPPGHHAERRAFGGFCYFNNNAVAAQYFVNHGKVSILDIDYHHGNGSQNIFYERSDVQTISIHGHPKFAYPYFTGFDYENGKNGGEGFNINFALKEKLDGEEYRSYLKKALNKIVEFNPQFLVLALGLDPAKGDPTGTWSLSASDFEENGKMIGKLKIPTLVVQEGGYKVRSLGINARRFFEGLWKGFHDK
ncbi:MAG: histone deacetylase family protein [Ignavibacteriales bacterium]|nr:histone deacetylase family protein [Ignavibacteriales bacterium]MCB9210074.1 histone deacetylase family protein [Ignavibacteriales bacterium]MCB9218541.1 histone deacetylase family protein [Ignavibacteriales bacterium]